VQGVAFSVTLYVREVHLTKVKPVRKRQTHLLLREDANKDSDRRGSVAITKFSIRELVGTWHRGEVTGCKLDS
jgi:hypothetical protein